MSGETIVITPDNGDGDSSADSTVTAAVMANEAVNAAETAETAAVEAEVSADVAVGGASVAVDAAEVSQNAAAESVNAATRSEELLAEVRDTLSSLPDAIAVALRADKAGENNGVPVSEIENTPPVEKKKDKRPGKDHWLNRPLFGKGK